MPNTYSQINIHGVFATKGRENILTKNLRTQLFPYINGIIKNYGMFPLAVNGFVDHVHVFFELPPDKSVAQAMQVIKANSSKWINDSGLMSSRFEWQSGYGAFSQSRSQRDSVIRYIMNQESHHAVKSFREEYLDLLKRFEIEFDERYLFEFYD